MSEEMTPLRKNPKKGLGRGLGSLLGEANTLSEPADFRRVETVAKIPPPPLPTSTAAAPAPAPAAAPIAAAPTPSSERIWKIAIEKIAPNKEQPRKHFDPTRLQELASSIKEKGILLPIIVRPTGVDTFEIVAGERRWRAAQAAGLQEVPILIRKSENREALELALIENVQRQDINPLEEAEAYGLLSTRYGLTQQQIAEKVSKDRATVANLMRLMSLATDVKTLLKTGELQLGQAKVLLSITDLDIQTRVARKVAKQKLSVRATERLVAKLKENPATELELEDAEESKREVQAVIQELQKLLGTKVELDVSGQRSKLSIHFYSVPELNQFLDRLRKL